MEPQLVSGRLLVTLDEGKDNVGRIVQHDCQGEARLMIPRAGPVVPEGEEPPIVPEMEYYDHVVFVKEMSDDVEVDGVTYVGMGIDAILAVIPDD